MEENSEKEDNKPKDRWKEIITYRDGQGKPH